MKLAARILSLILLASAATLYMSCKGSDPKPTSAEEKQLNKLKGTWALASVSLDGNSVDPPASDFQGVTLTISGNFVENGQYDYTFAGTFPTLIPFPKTGKFKFGSAPESQLTIIQDSQNLNYSLSNSDQNLNIFFTFTGAGYNGTSRVSEVEGNWDFNFTKQ